jgi:hypothetical protein
MVWALTRRVLPAAAGQVGAEKILFGTDTPLYFVAMQVEARRSTPCLQSGLIHHTAYIALLNLV